MTATLNRDRLADAAPALAMLALALVLALLGSKLLLVPMLGALTLAESAKLSENQFERGVIETFIQQSVVLDRIPFMDIEGNAYQYNEEATLPGVEFRAVNAAYTESTGTVNQKTEGLVILGGDADVDRFIQQTRSNLEDQVEVQTRLKVKAISYKYQDAFVNGDVAVDANSFDGLKKRLTGAKIVDAATNGLNVIGASSADRHAFFDKIDELLAAASIGSGADNTALYMNNLILGKFKSAARREGSWTQTIDEFGRTIDAYNGIPLLDIGKKADGTLIIPQTEVQGASSVASSIYAVRYGEDAADGGVTGLNNGGIMVDPPRQLETKPALRVRIEFYPGLAVFGGAARLRGVLNG
jgi:hypothetical protein